MATVMLLGANTLTAESASTFVEPLDAATIDNLKILYKQLIDAENRHDFGAVRTILWNSQSTLFVAKTATPAEGNWAGFWGTDVVMQHFHDLYQGPFKMEPDYEREKVVGLTADVAETYVPLKITVAYAGQLSSGFELRADGKWPRTSRYQSRRHRTRENEKDRIHASPSQAPPGSPTDAGASRANPQRERCDAQPRANQANCRS
jgi:hypothetical protein